MEWIDLVLLLAAEWFPTFKVTPKATRAAWLQLFKEHRVTEQEARKALSVAVLEGEKYIDAPTVVNAVLKLRKHSTSKQKTPAEVWAKLIEWAGLSLPFDKVKPKLGRQTLAALTSIGGWDRIRYADASTELPFIRRDFLKALESIAKRDAHHEALEESARILKLANDSTKRVA